MAPDQPLGVYLIHRERRECDKAQFFARAELEHFVQWNFSGDALQAANDQMFRLLDRLDLPNCVRRAADRLHTVSDGRKFEVRADSLNASRSYKLCFPEAPNQHSA